jgi:hypothetical protein
MSQLKRVLRTLILFSLAAVTFSASATNYTLWINGRGNTATIGNYDAFGYWGPSSTAAGVNKKAVNWDGKSHISTQTATVQKALDCFCTGSNWCFIATHSAGDLMMGYTQANYGGSARQIKNAVISVGGACTDSQAGATQTGWNIKSVRVASGAAGGSELSDYGSWAVSEELVQDLKTTTARALYNHNTTRNIWWYMYAGAKGTLYSALLPGQDDEAVAYHSTGGVSGTSGRGLGNPADFFSNDLTLGTAANEGGSVKWSYHSVSFRDDAEAYNHYANKAWQGIISVVRTAVVSDAK